MNVPLFLVLLCSLTLAHLHLTLPTVPSPAPTANPNPGNTEFWSEGNVFHLKSIVNQKKEERILKFEVKGFSSNSDDTLSASMKKSPEGQTWLTKFPNDDTLKMAQTRPIPDKKGGKAPIAEYSVVWKAAKKLPRHVDCREVCFHYKTTLTIPDPPDSDSDSDPIQTHWYSTFLEKVQNWPLNSENIPFDDSKARPFTTSSKDSTDAPIGTTVEYLFYSSAGFAIFLDDLHPWSIEVRSDAFCVSIPKMDTLPEDHPIEYSSLKWRILVAAGLPSLWEATLGTVRYIRRPSTPPNAASLLSRFIVPVSSIPDSPTNNWVEDIVHFKGHSGYPNALLYINGDPSGYSVNTPFTLPSKSGYQKMLVEEFAKDGQPIAFYLLQQYYRSHMPNGSSFTCLDYPEESTPLWCTFDFTSERTGAWFTGALEEFRQRTSLNAFFLQGAAVNELLPKGATLENPLLLKYPNFLTTLYSSVVQPFGDGSSFTIDAAFKSQALSSFITFQIDIENNDKDNPSISREKLQRLIPKLLTLSLAGYQFVLPVALLPEPLNHEDYLRWLSVCLFLPALQLPGKSPWSFTKKYEASIKERLELRVAVHRQVQVETLVDAWIHRGEPIIRPMWAADASDDNLLTIDNQYMLGPNLVVAPYLEQKNADGIYERSVYLPKGNWIDPTEKPLKGGKQFNVNSKLMDVPYFRRQQTDISVK